MVACSVGSFIHSHTYRNSFYESYIHQVSLTEALFWKSYTSFFFQPLSNMGVLYIFALVIAPSIGSPTCEAYSGLFLESLLAFQEVTLIVTRSFESSTPARIGVSLLESLLVACFSMGVLQLLTIGKPYACTHWRFSLGHSSSRDTS